MATNKKIQTRKVTKAKPKAKVRLGRSSLARSNATLFGGRRGFVVAGLLAIVGLVAVAFSFASGGTPDYQYSLSSGKSEARDVTYYAHSAEGFTYLAYKGLLGRTPEATAMNTWVQKLAGDRTKPGDVLASIMASSGVSSRYPKDKDFTNYIYKNFLGRTPDKKGQDYWLKQLKNGRSRQDIVRGFIAAKEVITYNKSALLALTPASYVETARTAQAKRGEDAKANASAAARYKEVAANNAKYAQSRRDRIKAIRDKPKSATTKADLSNAQNLQKALDGFMSGARSNYALAQDKANQNQKLLAAARSLEKRAPDLTATTVVKYNSSAHTYAAGASSSYAKAYQNSTDVRQYIRDIQNDLAQPAANSQGWIMGSRACGGDLPPCYVMMRESKGYINLYYGSCTYECKPGNSASGKWMFIRKTWGGFGGYRNAADAPESVQDAKARQLWNGGRGCSHWQACGRR